METFLPLSEILRSVQRELIQSEDRREQEGAPILFQTSGMEIELTTVIQQDASGKLKIGIPLFNGETDLSSVSKKSQTIKLKFNVTCLPNFDEDSLFSPTKSQRSSGRFPEMEGDPHGS